MLYYLLVGFCLGIDADVFFMCTYKMLVELGQSLVDFGKAVKLLGACEGGSVGKAFSELGSQSELLSFKLQKEVSENTLSL